MRRLGFVLAVGCCAFVGGGCGVLNSGKTSPEPVEDDQLAVMVVPRDQLGAIAKGLDLDDDSGPYGNKEAAEDTIDRRDTAASLRAAGRVGGYELEYSSPRALDIWRSGGGYTDITTSVELFENPSDAAVYLDTQARDFARFEGRNIGPGARLTKVDVTRVTDIADSAWALRGTIQFGKIVSHGTILAFRHGRIVGAVSIGRGDTRNITGPARIAARALDHRIAAVLDGTLADKPVPLPLAPGPGSVDRLKAMTLSLQDLPAGITVAAEGRKQASTSKFVYFRSFKVEGTPVFGSRLLTLRAESQLLATEGDARTGLAVLGSSAGRKLFEREFERRWKLPGHSSIAALRGLPAGMVGSVLLLRGTPKGSFKAYTITFRVKNVVETITAFGAVDGIDPNDLNELATRARARLDDAL
jgi:hypothetical protein